GWLGLWARRSFHSNGVHGFDDGAFGEGAGAQGHAVCGACDGALGFDDVVGGGDCADSESGYHGDAAGYGYGIGAGVAGEHVSLVIGLLLIVLAIELWSLVKGVPEAMPSVVPEP